MPLPQPWGSSRIPLSESDERTPLSRCLPVGAHSNDTPRRNIGMLCDRLKDQAVHPWASRRARVHATFSGVLADQHLTRHAVHPAPALLLAEHPVMGVN